MHTSQKVAVEPSRGVIHYFPSKEQFTLKRLSEADCDSIEGVVGRNLTAEVVVNVVSTGRYSGEPEVTNSYTQSEQVPEEVLLDFTRSAFTQIDSLPCLSSALHRNLALCTQLCITGHECLRCGLPKTS